VPDVLRVTTSSCASAPAAPGSDYQQTCPSYVHQLGGIRLLHVGDSTTGDGANRIVAQRFRATSDCGFDVVISLPGLRFAADDQPYDMSTWWDVGPNGTSFAALIFWRGDFSSPLFALAGPEGVEYLNLLLAPLAISSAGPACTDPAQAGNTSQIITKDGSPLPCEDEDGARSLRLCHDGDKTYRMVAYRGAPDATALPAVLGASDLLLPAE
jgi:hypothetical protein